MRALRLFEHTSLDGVIEIGMPSPAEGDFPYGDWTAPYRSPEGFAQVTARYGERFDLLLGRRTYDQWSEYWPKAPSSPMADRLNAATKFVVTHRPEGLLWGPAQAVGSGWAEAVEQLKASEGPDIIVAGSSSLTSGLLEHGLVDEVVLLVSPVLLGRGKRLLAEGFAPRALVREEVKVLPTGTTIQTFRVEGTLKHLRQG